jgi:hypothetical protein
MPLQLSELSDAESPDKEYLWTLNFGPQHPATHTTLRLLLTLDGETIVDAVPDIGYLHSGFEKLGEDLDFNQYVTIVDRMNYISPVANEIAWHHAVEKLIGVTITPRCTYVRTIFAELMRIHDHLLNVGHGGPRPGGLHAVFVCVQAAREDLRHLRVCLGPALPFQLHARRRRDVRRGRRLDRPREGLRGRLSGRARRGRRDVDEEPHLHRAAQGNRSLNSRGRDQLQLHGTAGPGQRRPP